MITLLTLCMLGADGIVPRPEHPRPDFERKEWVNLNGQWDFRFDPGDVGVKEEWFKQGTFDKKITVPFCWESKLSGIQNLDKENKIGWYRREIEVPANWQGKHVWLRFGAVDYEAKVWVNGKEVGSHVGGYTPFDIDITESVKPGEKATVVVRAFDPTDPFLPTGKQVGWYTTISGIWQTVWLEARPEVYLKDFTIRTEKKGNEWVVHIYPSVSGPRQKVPLDYEIVGAVTGTVGTDFVDQDAMHSQFTVMNPKIWTPETPHLYPLVIKVPQGNGTFDEVHTYFGLRTVGRGKFGDLPHESILLNDKPVYLRGALDQSYNPDGLYTAPSEEFLVKELEFAKSVNLNFLRIHIKSEEPRRLYLADKMGILIMQDIPNAWRHNQRTREHWQQCFLETYARSKNHPSIFSWCLFNETWGLTNGDYHNFKKEPETQQWVAKMFDMAKQTDPSRLIEDISPCHYDHVKSDIHSWHFYIDNDKEATKHIADVVKNTFPGSGHNCAPGWKQGTEPLINSEYGAVSAGGGDRDVSWGFRHLTTQLRRHSKIQGYIYTELTDIEWEHNGFANYDRTKKQFGYDAWVPGMTVADLQGPDFVGFTEDAGIIADKNELTLHPFVSHFDPNSRPAKIRWWVTYAADSPQTSLSQRFEAPVNAKLFDVVETDPIRVSLFDGKPLAGAVAIELLDQLGKRLACNYVNFISPIGSRQPMADVSSEMSPGGVIVRFKPSNYANSTFKSRLIKGNKFAANGNGEVEYRVKIPPQLVGKQARVSLRMETAARAGSKKVDWPSRPNAQDYPQTDERKHPSTITVAFGGKSAKVHTSAGLSTGVVLPDDPADARGVYSHMRHIDPGSYGYDIVADTVDQMKLPDVLSVKITATDGLSIFDGETGSRNFEPTLVIHEGGTLDRKELINWYGSSTTVDHARERIKPVLSSGATWKYTTDRPGRGWMSADFDASAWKEGPSGFGTQGTPGIKVKSNWNTPDIWARTVVDIPQGMKHLQARLYHDENVQVYVNGEQLLQRRGYITDYVDVPLDEKQQSLFKPGKNTIAIHCRQTGGGQGVDFELSGEQ